MCSSVAPDGEALIRDTYHVSPHKAYYNAQSELVLPDASGLPLLIRFVWKGYRRKGSWIQRLLREA